VWICAALVTSLGTLRPARPAKTESNTSIGNFVAVVKDARTLIAIGVVAMAFNRADYLVLSEVGTESEATRYALATRVVGPVLIALGSLNNSLYVRQIRVRDDIPALLEMTQRASRRVGALAVFVAPLAVGVVALLGLVSDTFARRSLVGPTALLSLATIPYAFAIPYGFALNATNRERWWLLIIGVATALDAAAVAILGSAGSITTALLWVGTQTLVLGAVRLVWRSIKGARLSTVAQAR
jgi:O-antigen/teichoic acid export membrane protein